MYIFIGPGLASCRRRPLSSNVGRNTFLTSSAVPELQRSLRSTSPAPPSSRAARPLAGGAPAVVLHPWHARRVTRAPSGARHGPPSVRSHRACQRRCGPPVRWRAANQRWTACRHGLWSLVAPHCALAPQAVAHASGGAAIRCPRPPAGRVRPAQPCVQADGLRPPLNATLARTQMQVQSLVTSVQCPVARWRSRAGPFGCIASPPAPLRVPQR